VFKYRAAAPHHRHARAKCGGDLVVPLGAAQQSYHRPISRSAGQPQVGHPAKAFFRVLNGVGRMMNLVFFDVIVCSCITAHRRLATIERAIWLATLCGEVPRQV